ncbi:MAG: YpiB family protein [Vagococcus sp.]
MIQSGEKRRFINWAMQSLSFKKREAYWILTYLVNHDGVLNNVILVENEQSLPRALIIRDQSVPGSGLELIKEGKSFDNPEQIFHDIRLNFKSPLYVVIKFDESDTNLLYQSVLESNPYANEEHLLFLEKLDLYFEEAAFDYQVSQLEQKINQALETENELLFLKLSQDYQQLKNRRTT